jgi:hypothetical protein
MNLPLESKLMFLPSLSSTFLLKSFEFQLSSFDLILKVIFVISELGVETVLIDLQIVTQRQMLSSVSYKA